MPRKKLGRVVTHGEFKFEEGRFFGPAMLACLSKQRLLVGAWVWGDYGNKRDAGTAAGYSDPHTIYGLFADPKIHAAIAEETNARIAAGGPRSIRVIEHLQENAQSEKVQLDAAKHMAGLAGHVQKQQVEHTVRHTLDDMTTEQLLARIDALRPKFEAPKIEGPAESIPANTDVIEGEFEEAA